MLILQKYACKAEESANYEIIRFKIENILLLIKFSAGSGVFWRIFYTKQS